jgi:hypothetical protein
LGGSGTDSVRVQTNGTGDYSVGFYGSFGSFDDNPALGDRLELVALASVTRGDGSHVAVVENLGQGAGSTAQPDLITIRVRIFKTDNLTLANKDFSVVVMR